ncbi:MAG: L,D-transpeptidase family protein [Lachnospiraceae bacterium]|nr:L,D-transpeptidase family protein [Lachnospiraceae bacterium]MCI9148901.1 L,D-transpeptidase family protein [Lachnospiraceae bacterium]
MSTTQKTGKGKIVIGILGVLLVLLAAAYIGIGIYYQSHFPFHTVINGVDCSGMTVEEVKSLITRETQKYELNITGRGGMTDRIESRQIGLHPEFDGSLEDVLESRSGFAWLFSLFRETRVELETMVNYDEIMFADAVEGLTFFDERNITLPEDAYISEYREHIGYEIIPEVEGNVLDRMAVEELLRNAVINLQSNVSLEENSCYEQPARRTGDEALNALAGKLNTCVSTAITYEFGSKSEQLEGSRIASWLTVSEDQQVTVNREEAAAFVKGLAERYDTYGEPRRFQTTWGPSVTFSGSEYGWRINQEEETNQLVADILEGKQESREPIYSQRGGNRDGEEDYSGTYVEVNITAQHLYFYKNGSLIVESDFVSGNEAKGWSTPSGMFSVTYTQRDAVLRGADYRTPVDFWMPFNGGIGFHDATWRDTFGGNIYLDGGSHGCINMPYDAAKILFQYLKAGDAVFVYRLEGTERVQEPEPDPEEGIVLPPWEPDDPYVPEVPVVPNPEEPAGGYS